MLLWSLVRATIGQRTLEATPSLDSAVPHPEVPGAADASARSPADYDCKAGPSNGTDEWDIRRKAWCCKNKTIGCSLPLAASGYDCNTGFSNWQLAWSIDKKGWCCKHEGKACPAAEDPRHPLEVVFNCNVG